jgi:uncharacterized protein YheU (UPF0270 family)
MGPSLGHAQERGTGIGRKAAAEIVVEIAAHRVVAPVRATVDRHAPGRRQEAAPLPPAMLGPPPEKPMTSVPPETLAASVLRALIEEFVTRDGTDYGEAERTLDEKVADVERQLSLGEVSIVFDPETESVNLVTARELEGRHED